MFLNGWYLFAIYIMTIIAGSAMGGIFLAIVCAFLPIASSIAIFFYFLTKVDILPLFIYDPNVTQQYSFEGAFVMHSLTCFVIFVVSYILYLVSLSFCSKE